MPVARPGSLNMVAVASEPSRRDGGAGLCQPPPPVSFRLRASGTDSRRVRYTRVAASTVCASAAWLRRRSGKASVHAMTAGAIGLAPGDPSDLTRTSGRSWGGSSWMRYPDQDTKAVASAIVALRAADALIVGPLSPDDANTPGLLPHLADLASQAYRALRPPREIIAHPAFAQVARRFQFIQMSYQEARAWGPARSTSASWRSGSARSRAITASSRSRPSVAMASSGPTEPGRKSNRSAATTWMKVTRETSSSRHGSWRVGSSGRRLRRRWRMPVPRCPRRSARPARTEREPRHGPGPPAVRAGGPSRVPEEVAADPLGPRRSIAPGSGPRRPSPATRPLPRGGGNWGGRAGGRRGHSGD